MPTDTESAALERLRAPETIRERATLRGQVRAMTANGRITAIILAALPFIIGGIMTALSNDAAMRAVDGTAVALEMPGDPARLAALRAGLQSLVRHFRLG